MKPYLTYVLYTYNQIRNWKEGSFMQKDMLSKTFILGVIFLFFSVGVHPAFANNIILNKVKQQLENKYSIKTNPVFSLSGLFMKTFGGTNEDIGYCVQQTTDGGYIISGYTCSYGNNNSQDVWLIKTDSNGNEIWNKTFGGPDIDWSLCVQQTTDGGYIITGYTELYSGPEVGDVWLIKTDSSGNEIWNKTFGGINYCEVSYSVQQTTDGGYVITGITWSYSDGSIWLIKTDSSGNEIWNKTFGGTGALDIGSCVRQTTDGGYIITGGKETSEMGYVDVWLIKTDSSGNEIWNKTFGGKYNDLGMCVQQTTDGGYIITGYTELYLKGDIWLIKTDSNGNKMWDKSYGVLQNVGWGNWVQQTTDGGYIVTGFAWKISGGYTSAWLIKTDSNGKKMWDKKLGGTNEDMGNCVQQTSDGGYVITGHTCSYGAGECDVWLVKTDKYGKPRNKAINKPTSNFLQSYPYTIPIITKTITNFFNIILTPHQNHKIFRKPMGGKNLYTMYLVY